MLLVNTNVTNAIILLKLKKGGRNMILTPIPPIALSCLIASIITKHLIKTNKRKEPGKRAGR